MTVMVGQALGDERSVHGRLGGGDVYSDIPRSISQLRSEQHAGSDRGCDKTLAQP
jgi:hypothetical protein